MAVNPTDKTPELPTTIKAFFSESLSSRRQLAMELSSKKLELTEEEWISLFPVISSSGTVESFPHFGHVFEQLSSEDQETIIRKLQEQPEESEFTAMQILILCAARKKVTGNDAESICTDQPFLKQYDKLFAVDKGRNACSQEELMEFWQACPCIINELDFTQISKALNMLICSSDTPRLDFLLTTIEKQVKEERYNLLKSLLADTDLHLYLMNFAAGQQFISHGTKILVALKKDLGITMVPSRKTIESSPDSIDKVKLLLLDRQAACETGRLATVLSELMDQMIDVERKSQQDSAPQIDALLALFKKGVESAKTNADPSYSQRTAPLKDYFDTKFLHTFFSKATPVEESTLKDLQECVNILERLSGKLEESAKQTPAPV